MTKEEFKEKVEKIKDQIYYIKFDDNKKEERYAYSTFWEITFKDKTNPFYSGWQSPVCLIKNLTPKEALKMFNQVKDNLYKSISYSFNLRTKKVNNKIVKDKIKLEDVKDIRFAFNLMRLKL